MPPSGVTGVFVKKIRLTRQKVFPLPTVGAPSASNSPSALSAQALRARPIRARAGLTIIIIDTHCPDVIFSFAFLHFSV